MRRRSLWRQAVVVALVVLVAGCANLTSIERSTGLPGGSTAVHLDAKQRLAVANQKGFVCAEPSPDALTTLASGIGLGVTTPQQVSASLASALAESGGSIGLRTQSISLMRDALYRVCEAYYNNALNPAMVMMLHQRYQNIMTAILAIEQLTGAVAAPALAAAGKSSASASAQLNDLQRQLEEALKNERARRAEANLAGDVADEKKQKLRTARTALQKLEQQSPPASEADLQTARKTVQVAEKEAKETEADAELARRMAEQAAEVRQSLERSRQAALTSANAGASGSAQLATATPPIRLSDASTQYITEAVKTIVTEVFKKDYRVDSCLNLLAGNQAASLQLRAQEDKRRLRSLTKEEERDVATLRERLESPATKSAEQVCTGILTQAKAN